ncbi:unnamed protein product [Cochlearia groenlandica]
METPPPSPAPVRSKRLHNFTLPYLRWGHQRSLRCVKLPNHHPSPSPSVSRGGVVISERELMVDPAHGPGKHKVSVLGNGEEAIEAARPWNLRTRRAACNEPESIIESSPLLRRNEIGVKRGYNEGGVGELQKKEKVLKFSVSLLREEIEDDFAALIGKKPPRRPKKRPRIVQKQMNTLFPGLWLAEEVTADSYDAAET